MGEKDLKFGSKNLNQLYKLTTVIVFFILCHNISLFCKNFLFISRFKFNFESQIMSLAFGSNCFLSFLYLSVFKSL